MRPPAAQSQGSDQAVRKLQARTVKATLLPGLTIRLLKGLSRMLGNSQARFLEGRAAAMPSAYSIKCRRVQHGRGGTRSRSREQPAQVGAASIPPARAPPRKQSITPARQVFTSPPRRRLLEAFRALSRLGNYASLSETQRRRRDTRCRVSRGRRKRGGLSHGRRSRQQLPLSLTFASLCA